MSFLDSRLEDIRKKVEKGERLGFEDGLTLYQTNDLIGLGRLADRVRRRMHGDTAFYVYNQHINYTNVCLNRCRFCAFARDRDENGAYTYSLEEIRIRLTDRIHEPIRELHIVGGVNPALPFEYYLDLLRTVREIRPNAVIKAFTAVEIDHLSQLSGMSLEETIEALKQAGLGMIPGGGAEVLNDRVWQELFPEKINSQRWLEVMTALHRAGLPSNATMLYGHIETPEERVRHLMRLRDLQDNTNGFSAFIPLAFHPQNTKLSHLPGTTALDDLKAVAAARLMLDNFPHIKAYWVMIGEKLAQTALNFGADDLDGTIIEEKITHMAGAASPRGLTRERMETLITSAGFRPVERDSFYNPVSRPDDSPAGKWVQDVHETPDTRIGFDQALRLYHEADLLTLGQMAGAVRWKLHPDPVVTFVVDRNINYTNVCVSGCRFCAFYKPPGHGEGYVISRESLAQKIRETLDLGGTQILLQGGMNPDLTLADYLDLLRYIKQNFNIHIHGFSPPEIVYLAEKSRLMIEETLERLMDAGLNSIPGGGAEILDDEVRQAVSPNKCRTDQWLGVMRAAHHLGLKTTATMMFGHVEKPVHIIRHLMKIRDLQDETRGFTAFIPWTFQPENTRISVRPRTAAEYLRVLALSRMVLDNVPGIQASWVTQGDKIGQTALFFGANDLGSTMIEENVVAAAGVRFRLPKQEMIRLIQAAGFKAVQRDCFYNHLRTFEE